MGDGTEVLGNPVLQGGEDVLPLRNARILRGNIAFEATLPLVTRVLV